MNSWNFNNVSKSKYEILNYTGFFQLSQGYLIRNCWNTTHICPCLTESSQTYLINLLIEYARGISIESIIIVMTHNTRCVILQQFTSFTSCWSNDILFFRSSIVLCFFNSWKHCVFTRGKVHILKCYVFLQLWERERHTWKIRILNRIVCLLKFLISNYYFFFYFMK